MKYGMKLTMQFTSPQLRLLNEGNYGGVGDDLNSSTECPPSKGGCGSQDAYWPFNIRKPIECPEADCKFFSKKRRDEVKGKSAPNAYGNVKLPSMWDWAELGHAGLEVVTVVGKLPGNPRIGDGWDEVRIITSMIKPGHRLSASNIFQTEVQGVHDLIVDDQHHSSLNDAKEVHNLWIKTWLDRLDRGDIPRDWDPIP